MPTNESTPLVDPDAAHAFLTASLKGFQQKAGEFGSKTKEAFSKENLDKTRAAAEVKFNELKDSVVTGNVSIRMLAMAGGFALLLASFISFVRNLFALEFGGALLEFYTCCLGLIILVLESQVKIFPDHYLKKLHTYALFLKYVWGRGCLYFVAGSMQLAEGASWTGYVVASMVTIVGAVYIYTGYQTAKKLATIKSDVTLATLKEKFDEMGSEAISSDQFWELCTNLDIAMSRPETEAAFLLLDKDDSNTVTFEEVRLWYTKLGPQDIIV